MQDIPQHIIEKVEFFNKHASLFTYGTHKMRIKKIYLDRHPITQTDGVYMTLHGFDRPQNVGQEFDKNRFFEFYGSGKNM